MQQLSHTLDDEFKRIAKEEGLTLEDLVTEVASLTKKKARQIYNFRSGKSSLPSDLLPILCKRFGSLALIRTLEECCEETKVEIPDGFELGKLVSQTVRDDLRHYERFMDAFEDGVIERTELDELNRSGERVVQNVRMFLEIATADYQRRVAFKQEQIQRNSNGTIQRNS